MLRIMLLAAASVLAACGGGYDEPDYGSTRPCLYIPSADRCVVVEE